MATSGTYNTVITVDDIINHALRRAGMEPSQMTPDIALSARQNLYFTLLSLANEGINLWSLTKEVIGLQPGQVTYPLPTNTNRILTGLYRTITLPSGGSALSSDNSTNANNAFANNITLTYTQSAANGWIGYNFGSNVTIRNVAILPSGTQTLSLVWEASQDGVTWQTLLTSPTNEVYTDNVWVAQDIDGIIANAPYFRVRETGGGTLSVHSLIFGQYPQETVISQLQRTQYWQQVDKNQPAGNRSTQYWFDRQINPQVWLWTPPLNPFDQVVFWISQLLHDVGTLQESLEIPVRWTNSVISDLAALQYTELPRDKRDPDPNAYTKLVAIAIEAHRLAAGEETDGSPISLMSDNTAYTA